MELLENENKDRKCPDGPKIDWSKSKLNDSPKNQLTKLFREFNDVFSGPNGALGHCTPKKHKNELSENAEPTQKSPYRLAPNKRQEMGRQIDKLLQQNIIRQVDYGEWSSPALLVPKGPGGWLLVVDYKALGPVLSYEKQRSSYE